MADRDGSARVVTDAPAASTGPAVRRRTRRRRLMAGVVVSVLLLVLAWAAWLVSDGLSARRELQAAGGLVDRLQQHVVDGDREAASSTLVLLQQHAAEARGRTHGPGWSAAGVLPVVGDDVRAVQVVSEVVSSLAEDALPGLMGAAELVEPAAVVPTDGRIDLAPLQEAGPAVIAADATVQRAVDRLTAIERERLVGAVARPVAQLTEQVQQVAATTGTVSRAAELIPPMLGADGVREYLLLVQNNAEPRALGGIPGAVILLRADRGVVELVELRNAAGVLANLPEPAVPLTDVERSVFGEQLGVFMADVTFTPDFPRAAQIATAIWEQRIGGHVDGVVSMDTGALAAVLAATGPVPLPPGEVADAVGGALTADNAVEVLNNTVYRLVEDFTEQDAFFASTGSAVFEAVLSGRGDPGAAVSAMASAAQQRRLMVWSSHEGEQGRLAGTVLSGELRGADGDAPVLGVYVNDGTGSKIGYYLRAEVDVRAGACAVDGTRAVESTATFTSTAPADVVDMPPYISGGNVLEPGRMRFNVLAYAPEGGYFDDVEVSDGSRGGASHLHHGLYVIARTIELGPGESVTVRYESRTAAGQTSEPIVAMTPLVDHDVDIQGDWRCR